MGFCPHGLDSCAPVLLRAVGTKVRAVNTVLSVNAGRDPHEPPLVQGHPGTRSIPGCKSLGLRARV
ncbi:MAG: hypothetical protein RMK90_08345 [Acetobacteraceae bacterium]|nr:hypothetical protein [Acetobacteraceae bacterium]